MLAFLAYTAPPYALHEEFRMELFTHMKQLSEKAPTAPPSYRVQVLTMLLSMMVMFEFEPKNREPPYNSAVELTIKHPVIVKDAPLPARTRAPVCRTNTRERCCASSVAPWLEFVVDLEENSSSPIDPTTSGAPASISTLPGSKKNESDDPTSAPLIAARSWSMVAMVVNPAGPGIRGAQEVMRAAQGEAAATRKTCSPAQTHRPLHMWPHTALQRACQGSIRRWPEVGTALGIQDRKHQP
eukprot:294821-Prymnesium_polylepis.1